MSFAELKRNKQNISALKEKMQNETKVKSFEDNRFWKLTKKDGVGQAVIRFLPSKNEFPYVKVYSHSFKDKGGWYFQNCPSTIEKECPVCKSNGKLWNSGVEDNKNIARNRKRKLEYITNIYVVEDNENPENEGKVFLMKFGQQIFDLILSKMSPEFEDDEPVNVFDLWEGANFKMRYRTVGGQKMGDYKKSVFATPAPLKGNDDELEAIYNQTYDLSEFIADDKFKDPVSLTALFNRALGIEPDENDVPPPPTKKVEQKVEEKVTDEAETSDDDEAWLANL